MQICRQEGKHIIWYSIPDFALINSKGKEINCMIKTKYKDYFPDWGDCFDKWVKLGKPWGYQIFCRKTQTRRFLSFI